MVKEKSKLKKRNEESEIDLKKFDEGYHKIIVGIDEAGRGPLAGPVVASAVIVQEYFDELKEINDSKKLSEKKREKLFDFHQLKQYQILLSHEFFQLHDA